MSRDEARQKPGLRYEHMKSPPYASPNNVLRVAIFVLVLVRFYDECALFLLFTTIGR